MDDNRLMIVAEIVRAYVSNNSVRPTDLPQLIADVNESIASLSAEPAVANEVLEPAVNPKKSVFPDFIVSLENGKRFKSLKRHLSTLGMTPDEYRTKWGLPRDYPMVAADYASRRSELAKQIGLGRKASADDEPSIDLDDALDVLSPDDIATVTREANDGDTDERTTEDKAEAPSKQRRSRG